jgi:hypothetical protein
VTTFDYIKDIIITKRGDLPLDGYAPFLINRFLSFINPQVCEAVNQLNTKILLEDKLLHYKLMLSLFPKMSSVPYIKYVKKVQEEKDENQELKTKIKVLAQNMELSEREVTTLLSSF